MIGIELLPSYCKGDSLGFDIMKDLVSIVIPIYNVESYLDRCINSVVLQTYENVEIILIDDGSTDRSSEICDEWAARDSRIVVIHKQNAGLGMARNSGIDKARGKYIFFFDSDDYVDTDIVRKCVENAQKNDSDVVIYGRYCVYEDGRIGKGEIKTEKTVYTDEMINNELLPGMFTYDMGFGVSAWGRMYRLDIINENGIRFVSEREIISEDAYFTLEFFPRVTRASILKENLYYYYNRISSLSRIYKKDRQKYNDHFLKKALQYVENENLPQKLSVHIMARYQKFTVSTLKQVVMADLPSKSKRAALNEIFDSEMLRQTLRLDVLSFHSTGQVVFFTLLKFKQYWLCRRFLYLKMRLSK